MTQHYIGFNRGVEGFAPSDFTTGTATGSTDMELRYDDTKTLTREDVYKFCKACMRFLDSQVLMASASQPPPDL